LRLARIDAFQETSHRDQRSLIEETSLSARLRMSLLSRKELLRDGAIVFVSTMTVNALNYVIHFILSRRLGVVEYGAFVSVMSVLAIVVPVTIVTMVVVKLVAEFHALDDRVKIRELSYRLLKVGGIAGFAAVAAAVLLRDPITAYLRLSNSATVVAAAFVVCFALVLPAVRGVLQGVQDFRAYAISITFEGLGKVGFAVALAYAGFGVPGVFAGYAFAGALSLAYTVHAVRRHWAPGVSELRIDIRRLLQTTGAVFVGTSALALIGFIDVPLVKHFFEPQKAGIYSAVSLCGKILFFVVGFVPVLILPKAAHRAAKGNASVGVLWQGLALMFVPASAGALAFFLFPQFIVRLTLGAAFTPAAPYIFEYGIAMVLLATTNAIVTYNIGLHRYIFVLPLIAVAVLEPTGIALFHASLQMVVEVMLATNALALIACLACTPFRVRNVKD
jgi:O-antigen/teichoic acid export membrane protein